MAGPGRRELEPVVDEHDRRVRELQHELLQLHAGLDGQPAGADGYDSTAQTIFAVTEELLDYEAGIATARAATRAARRAEARRRNRLIIWWMVEAMAVAGLLVVVLAATGVLATARIAVGVAIVLSAGAMALSMSDRVSSRAGRWALSVRRAIVFAAATAFVVICAGVWAPGTFVAVPLLAFAAWPLIVVNSEERGRGG